MITGVLLPGFFLEAALPCTASTELPLDSDQLNSPYELTVDQKCDMVGIAAVRVIEELFYTSENLPVLSRLSHLSEYRHMKIAKTAAKLRNDPWPYLRTNELSEFQARILRTLLLLKTGHTASYKDIAELSGSPSAQRAVGSALNKNPYPLLIPCHSVIRSDGNIGKYAGMQVIKEFLVERHGQSSRSEVRDHYRNIGRRQV